MSSATGVIGGGSLREQIKPANASGVAGTVPAVTVPLLIPAAVTATFSTGGIQRKGANAIQAQALVGAISSSGLYNVKVEHSNDDGVTDAYTDLAASTQNVTGCAVTTGNTVGGAATNTLTVLNTDLRDAKLWVRYTWTLISGTGATVAMTATLGAYDTLPASGN